MTEKEKMLAGELCRPNDPELQSDLEANRRWLGRFNSSLGLSALEIAGLIRDQLGSVGTGAFIRPPFHCDYGYSIHLGEDVF